MKIASRRWTLLLAVALATLTAGCHHKSSSSTGVTQPTPVGSVPWSWVSGADIAGRSGVYPPQATALLQPGGRDGAASWIDSNGNLWVFGGIGFDVAGAVGNLNDLWEYTGGVWKCVSGSNTVNAPGGYGTLGTGVAPVDPTTACTTAATAATVATNGTTPGARTGASAWVDATNNLWMFGGTGVDANGTQGNLNDLWKFDTAAGVWTWVNGSSTANAKGIYATATGVPATAVVPGARVGAVSFTDAAGDFWLFGGGGYDSVGNNGLLNDLWKYSPTTGLWTFTDIPTGVTGTTTIANVYPIYGTRGTAAATNVPGGRQSGAGWVDQTGNLWLFGGTGFDINHLNGYLDDLWTFSPKTGQWTWSAGASSANAPGVYGTLATPATSNLPGARAGAATVRDSAGNFWLFGGQGYDSGANQGYLNDLWEYNVANSTWQYVSGATFVNGTGTYGTLGAAGTTAVVAGARYGSSMWIDSKDDIWIFGGAGYDVNSLLGEMNDLWKNKVTP